MQGTEHAPAPVLDASEVQPETIPAEALFIDAFTDDDWTPPGKLSDIWRGKGYDTDPDAQR